ncbi:natural killer cells antigen CD94-like [Echinops telfairi]|uniref:Natural killer cells antigen CD94-like n=1 Tax=Echinops telfairi TaxID=9371 RepID=A0AC55DBU4_ECHTE|nr:natural killer cells antigen CD94-like [Echinops telfairi]
MAVFHTVSWRLISGILGVICFLLMATLGILLKNFSCCLCPEKWIGFRCNCYFISNETKTWAESRRSCASQNSSLLTLESWGELGFLKHSEHFYWLGLSYNETYGAWLWEDGSALSRDLFSSHNTFKLRNCVIYKPPKDILEESCGGKLFYICKQQPF